MAGRRLASGIGQTVSRKTRILWTRGMTRETQKLELFEQSTQRLVKISKKV